MDKAVESEKIYDEIHQKTWVRRTCGFLGGATLGLSYGAAIGAVAAFLPFIFGAIGIASAASLPALSAIAASAGLFASIGAGLGLAIGADVAANAGSNAATFEMEQQNAKARGKSPSIPSRDEGKSSGLYTWKAAPVLIALFAAFGAMLALTPVTAPAVALLGFKGAVAATATAAAQPATAAAIAASASVFGMFGALMPLKNSLFHNKISNFYFDLLSNKKAEKEESVQPHCEPARTVETPMLGESQAKTRSFSTGVRSFSLEGILDKTEDRGATLTR